MFHYFGAFGINLRDSYTEILGIIHIYLLWRVSIHNVKKKKAQLLMGYVIPVLFRKLWHVSVSAWQNIAFTLTDSNDSCSALFRISVIRLQYWHHPDVAPYIIIPAGKNNMLVHWDQALHRIASKYLSKSFVNYFIISPLHHFFLNDSGSYFQLFSHGSFLKSVFHNGECCCDLIKRLN